MIKSLGDKGGDSFKECVMLMNMPDSNAASNCTMLSEFNEAHDSHINLNTALKPHKAEFEALHRSSLVMFECENGTAAKIIPGKPGNLNEIALVRMGDEIPDDADGSIADWPAPRRASAPCSV